MLILAPARQACLPPFMARARDEPLVVQGMQPGGQLTITTDVENYPGRRSDPGPWLMQEMQAQAEHVGANDLGPDRRMSIFQAPVPAHQRWRRCLHCRYACHLHQCAGAMADVGKEQALSGKGVSACATLSDGFFYRGKKVVVIGGGNTAAEEGALYLTNHSQDVTDPPARSAARSEKILQERLFAHPNIKVL